MCDTDLMKSIQKLNKLRFIGEMADLFEEILNYHRDDNGKIVKIQDDLICAIRYAYMMRRYAVRKYDIIDKGEEYDDYEIAQDHW